MSEEKAPVKLSFKEQWEIRKLMKRAKKKAKHSLQEQGFGRREASAKVNAAVDRIATNKPERKSAGRGR
jgi:hypothetical protein